ncbi:hypothetical protein BOX15_Mlig024828g3 [Macrostomum lignano]|nr:hypothetical protein BOX15_Mlig024828g3 [Macrostomum lignano]
MIKATRDLRCVAGILCLLGPTCSGSVSSFQSFLTHVLDTLMLLLCDQIVLNFSEVLLIHNARFSKRVAFQSHLSLIRHHNMPDNTFWNPVATASKQRGLELVLVHFRFAVSSAQAIIHLTKRLRHSGSADFTDIDLDLLNGFYKELSSSELSDIVGYQTLARGVEQLQQAVANVSARDMRSIAYASYSTVRMPRMRLVAQTVALLSDTAASQHNIEKLLASEVNQASEGRQILCTEEALKRLVRELNPVQFFARLQHNTELWNRLESFDASSNCSFSAITAKPQQHQPACPDHGSYHQACLLWAWFRSVVSAVAVLRRTSRVFASPDAVRGSVERFIAVNADFFEAHAGDLLESGEMEPALHDLLTDLLTKIRQRRRRVQALSRLPPPPGAAAPGQSEVGSATAASVNGLSFELRLLPSLCFHFVQQKA